MYLSHTLTPQTRSNKLAHTMGGVLKLSFAIVKVPKQRNSSDVTLKNDRLKIMFKPSVSARDVEAYLNLPIT